MHIVVSNQWGSGNINNFINKISELGYKINIESNEVFIDNRHEDSKNIEESLESVGIIIRNSEDAPLIADCPYFDLNVSSLGISFTIPLSTEKLKDISDEIFSNSDKINEIKSIASKYNLVYDKVPQLWIFKLNEVDISVGMKYFFDGNGDMEEELHEKFELNDYDLDNFFESDCVYSLEGLGEW